MRSQSERCPRGHKRIRIRYFALPNENKLRGGFCPLYTVNRQRMLYNRKQLHVRGDEFCKGYDRDEALRDAREMAQNEAARYRGDWCVTIVGSARRPQSFAGARRRRRR